MCATLRNLRGPRSLEMNVLSEIRAGTCGSRFKDTTD